MANTKKSKKTTKAPTTKEMVEAIIDNMDRMTDEDVEVVLRDHLVKLGADRIKEMYQAVVELPEQRVDAILAGLHLLAEASDAKRKALGIEWSTDDIQNLAYDLREGELELVETEGE